MKTQAEIYQALLDGHEILYRKGKYRMKDGMIEHFNTIVYEWRKTHISFTLLNECEICIPPKETKTMELEAWVYVTPTPNVNLSGKIIYRQKFGIMFDDNWKRVPSEDKTIEYEV